MRAAFVADEFLGRCCLNQLVQKNRYLVYSSDDRLNSLLGTGCIHSKQDSVETAPEYALAIILLVLVSLRYAAQCSAGASNSTEQVLQIQRNGCSWKPLDYFFIMACRFHYLGWIKNLSDSSEKGYVKLVLG